MKNKSIKSIDKEMNETLDRIVATMDRMDERLDNIIEILNSTIKTIDNAKVKNKK